MLKAKPKPPQKCGELAMPIRPRDLQHSFCPYKTNVAWVFGYAKNRTLSPQLNAWPFGKAKWPKRPAPLVSGGAVLVAGIVTIVVLAKRRKSKVAKPRTEK